MKNIEWIKDELKMLTESVDDDDSVKEIKIKAYYSILKGMEAFTENMGSDFITGSEIAQDVFNKIIKGTPLTPIQNIDEDWVKLINDSDDGSEIYCHKRMNTLYKVIENGEVSYSGGKEFIVFCDGEMVYGSFLIAILEVLNKYYPVSFPFIPTRGIYKINIEKCLSNRENDTSSDNADTIHIINIVEPDGNTTNVDVYYGKNNGTWTEINESDYEARLTLSQHRIGREVDSYFSQNYNYIKDVFIDPVNPDNIIQSIIEHVKYIHKHELANTTKEYRLDDITVLDDLIAVQKKLAYRCKKYANRVRVRSCSNDDELFSLCRYLEEVSNTLQLIFEYGLEDKKDDEI